MWIIWNQTQRKYVSKPGMDKSYTMLIAHVRTFDTEGAAKADCCGDERPIRMVGADLQLSRIA